MGCSKGSSKREIYSNKHTFIKKEERFPINNLMSYFKELEKENKV
jgi:hypothetical protein